MFFLILYHIFLEKASILHKNMLFLTIISYFLIKIKPIQGKTRPYEAELGQFAVKPGKKIKFWKNFPKFGLGG